MDARPLLPLRHCAVLPGCTRELFVGRPATLAMLDQVGLGGQLLTATQWSAAQAYPRGLAQLHPAGCLVRLEERWTTPSGSQKVRVRGLERVQLVDLQRRMLQLWARAELALPTLSEDAAEAALHTYLENRESWGLAGEQPSAAVAVYRMSEALIGEGPAVLDVEDLDDVLTEILDAADRAAGAGWLH